VLDILVVTGTLKEDIKIMILGMERIFRPAELHYT
jgi:hypothetical protein